jgi:hypothetical protein
MYLETLSLTELACVTGGDPGAFNPNADATPDCSNAINAARPNGLQAQANVYRTNPVCRDQPDIALGIQLHDALVGNHQPITTTMPPNLRVMHSQP